MAVSRTLIKSFSKKTSKSEVFITSLWEKIEKDLIKQGIFEDNNRFYPYLLVKIKKELKITESSKVILTFREFLEDRNI